MEINPGELNKRIQIITISTGEKNENGIREKETELVVRSPWAKVTNTSGTEIQRANTEFATAKKRFIIRYSKQEITTDMIVKYGGKKYNILYVSDMEDKHEFWEIWTDIKEMI